MVVTRILTLILASVFFLFLLELIREEKLTFKYAVGWLVLAILAFLGAIFDGVLFELSHIFGFELTSNFIFFSIISILVFISLMITIFLCQQNSRNDTIAQNLGTLEFEIKELKTQLQKERDDKDSYTSSE
ncbi:MAG: hypothetical protein ACI9F2_000118 [Lysobacterales bacterium]|jgi:hypothetical protein